MQNSQVVSHLIRCICLVRDMRIQKFTRALCHVGQHEWPTARCRSRPHVTNESAWPESLPMPCINALNWRDASASISNIQNTSFWALLFDPKWRVLSMIIVFCVGSSEPLAGYRRLCLIVFAFSCFRLIRHPLINWVLNKFRRTTKYFKCAKTFELPKGGSNFSHEMSFNLSRLQTVFSWPRQTSESLPRNIKVFW